MRQATSVGDDPTPTLSVDGIRRSFGEIEVLHGISLSVAPGEVRALIGENGAGKSTLVRILGGALAPDAGSIELDGAPYHPAAPAEAIRRGVSVVHQEQTVVPGLSVAENVALGHPVPTRWGRVAWRELNRQATELLAALGQDLDVRADAAGLTVVARTMVALARALLGEVRVLVLDEPTASLTDAETQEVFAAVRRLAARGVAVLYVSHRLAEVLELCDTFTVLRDGVVAAQGMTSQVTVDWLVATMAGRPVDAVFPSRPTGAGGEVVLFADDLNGEQVRGVRFDVRAGEILGIAGLAGSGRSEVLRLVAGAQDARSSVMRLAGEPYAPRTVRQAQRAGVVYVPQDRRSQGLISDSIERNVNVTTLDRHTVAGAVVAVRAATRHAARAIQEVNVTGAELADPVFALSGGNQQRVVLAKYLVLQPTLLLLDEPTRGVDVHTKAALYHLIRARADAGAAVVTVSSELPELIGWCDRILVLHDGRSMGVRPAVGADELDLLRACYGRVA